MIRNLKMLGLLAFAALALGAVFASAALAEGTKGTYYGGITPDKENVTITGTQEGASPNNHFIAGENTTTCANAGVDYTGTIPEIGTKLLTVTPHFNNCTTGPNPTTVTMNGCDFTFKEPTTIVGGKFTADADLTCPTATGPILHIYGNQAHSFNLCTVEITAGAHTGKGANTHYVRSFAESHVVFTNLENHVNNEWDAVTAEATIKNIPYHKSGLCGAESANGEFTTTVTIEGLNDSGTHNQNRDVWVEHP